MNHIFAEDSVGNLILIALRFLQIESGSGKHILFHPDEYIPYLTACWLTSLRDFLARHNIQLEVTKAKLIEKSRKGDCYLMDDFRALGIFDDDELYDINLCQIFLQVTTLSDIADAASKAISAEIFDGKKSSDRFSLHRWPRQPVVTTRQRNLWKKALEAAYTSTGWVLKTPLGRWTGPPSQVWRQFYDVRSRRVVTSTTSPSGGTRFTEHAISSQTWHHSRIHPVTIRHLDWSSLVPATIIPHKGEGLSVAFHELDAPTEELSSAPTNFLEYVDTSPEVSR
jgi:hypothetical protein